MYSIGTVAEMLDVPVGTLRTWEDRYGLVIPDRSSGGHRLYSREQIEQLRYIVAKVSEGMQPGDAHRLLADQIAMGAPLSVSAIDAPRLAILLAERDPQAADFTDFFLRTEGYEVAIALEADEAQAAFERQKPDLAIVDLLISAGGGLALCRWLKEGGRTRVLAVSTLATREVALAAGADAFMQKPLDPLALVATVRDLLGRSALTNQSWR